MKCIYCKRENINKNRSHALPEAIFQNTYLLPNGVICDNCNKSCSPLDQSIITHPEIARRIQLLGLSGKRGKRKRLGYFKRDRAIEFQPWDVTKIEIQNNGTSLGDFTIKSRMIIKLKPPADFKQVVFSRAMHYLALNLLAYMNYDLAIQDKYDGIRNFVYDKKNKDIRTCYRDPVYENIAKPKITIDQIYSESKEYFLINILGVKFYIACDSLAEKSEVGYAY